MESQSDGKAKKPVADPSAKEIKKIAEKLEIDEIRPDCKIGKRVRYDPNEHQRW